MTVTVSSARSVRPFGEFLTLDRVLLASNLLLQLFLGLFLGHAYDLRILMAAGHLVGSGQNPYFMQDLSAVFHNSTFQGITTIGYPPPWALVLGLMYVFSYRLAPNFLFYNLAIKLPVIAANICLAYLVAHILRKLGAGEKISRRARLLMLFNPYLLLTSSAWGQFDPVVILLSLLALLWISEGRLTGPAILMGLAISLKPTVLPLLPVIFVYLAGRSLPRMFRFFAVFALSLLLFCAAPFAIFGWDPSPILQHWNYHFTIGGGLSFMTFLEFTTWSYQLTGRWWMAGWLWVPALGLATLALRPGIKDLEDLLRKSAAFLLVFLLCRAWVSDTNINLILPFVVILTSLNQLNRFCLPAVWVLPLVYSFFSTSIAQLFFPSLPGFMDVQLKWAVEYLTARYAFRTVAVALWLLAGWWTSLQCFQNAPAGKQPEAG
jgi:hypothetical protein